MKNICPGAGYFIVLLILLCPILSKAVVTVTPASGLCLNVTPGAYSTISNIVITEGSNSDISVQSGATIILSAPSGFEFLASTGSVSYQSGRNISAASIVISATNITVTFTCGGTNSSDILTISGIQARGTVAMTSGTILRTGGTANINGDNVVDGINHGNLSTNGIGTTVTSVASGNWSSGAIWSTGIVPICGQDVIINHTVTANVTGTHPNLTINTGGNLIAANAITVTNLFTISGTGTYTHDNNADASSTIFSASESFSSTSNLIFNQWYSLSTPLGSMVSGSFGNITFNTSGTWQQNGYFAPAKIQGNIIISSGTIVMDNGTGMTTALTLNDVSISGSGNLTVCSGTNRNFTFVTGNFADAGTGNSLSSIMNNCTGTLSWTANGDVTLDDNFSVMESCGSPAGATINITGDFFVRSGTTYFLKSTNAPATITINGRTSISGSGTSFIIANSGVGAMNFTSGTITFSGNNTYNIFNSSFAGTNQITVNGNLEITGSGTVLNIMNITGYTPTVNVNVTNDILVADGQLYVANSSGPVDVICGRNTTINGTTGLIKVQSRIANTALIKITISGSLSLISGTYIHSNGEGDVVMTLGESIFVDGGNLYGVVHTAQPTAATATFSFDDFIFRGGLVKLFTLKASTVTLVTINCDNNFDIIWESDSDLVELVSYDGNNDAHLDLNIGGNLSISGNYPNAIFLSSKAGGDEVIFIAGSILMNGGKAFFVRNNSSTSGVDAHDITFSILTDIVVTDGELFLSTRQGTILADVAGNVSVSGGTLNLKWLDGVAVLNIDGNYTQTGGQFNFHAHNSATSDTCKVTINGDFLQTGGILNFDIRNGINNAEHTLTFNGPNFTIGGTGIITHGNNLTTRTVWGQLYFNRTGTTVYSRTSGTHNIQHVKQTIRPSTTVDASASTFGFQMTSNVSANSTNHNSLTIDGTIDMGDKILSSRQYSNYYSQLTLNNGGRYRTSHTGGLYSGNAVLPSSIDGFISAQNRVNYFLASNSIVEYYGTSTSVVTGVPNGIATGVNQQYGILEINFSGVAGSTWVHPETDDEVRIRTTLILTTGEFNLDSDHVTNSGGRSINLENGATTSRTNGFIRSETEDGSGVVKWNITANSTNVIPFGYDAANYIPFTYQQTSGSSGVINVGTFHTIADNTPYPPTVTHVNDINGVNNSGQTVDRFWNIAVPGSANANLVFSYVPLEGTGIVSPRAQRWEPVSTGWFPPLGIQSNPTGITTSVSGVSGFNTWWTLSAASSPLPIELLEFNAVKKGTFVALDWTTLTEINNNFFSIERSENGYTFTTIETILGAGHSTSPLHYATTDQKPLQGINYYRLKQTDYDGNFSYSDIKLVDFYIQKPFKVYPNPVTINSSIQIELPLNGDYDILITDLSGKRIYFDRITIQNSENYLLNNNSLLIRKGIYFIMIKGREQVFTQKLIFQ